MRLREGRAVNIHMFCSRRPGLLLSTMRALDNLGLDIQQAVISCFNGFALDIFRAEVLFSPPLQRMLKIFAESSYIGVTFPSPQIKSMVLGPCYTYDFASKYEMEDLLVLWRMSYWWLGTNALWLMSSKTCLDPIKIKIKICWCGFFTVTVPVVERTRIPTKHVTM